jgi:hypothetical protein
MLVSDVSCKIFYMNIKCLFKYLYSMFYLVKILHDIVNFNSGMMFPVKQTSPCWRF